MALTRAQWEDLWVAIKRIEAVVPKDGGSPNHHAEVQRNVVVIKQLVQQVIGQME